MTDADIKLKLFRLIDNLSGNVLLDTYDLLKTKIKASNPVETSKVSDIESQYKKMAKDKIREKDALEWIEGTMHTDES